MTEIEITPRALTKFAVKMTIQVKTAALTRQAIADNTVYETTDTPVVVVGAVVGLIVAEKAKRYTDVAVDKTFDFVTEKLEARKAKKSAKTETKK